MRYIFLVFLLLSGSIFFSSYVVIANDDSLPLKKNQVVGRTIEQNLDIPIFDEKLDIYKIDSQEIDTHIRTLSSVEFQGRQVGTEGNRKAAQYIADYFRKINLLPGGEGGGYFQTFHLFDESHLSGEMNIFFKNEKARAFKCGESYIPLSNIQTAFVGPFTLIGYGISSPLLGFDEYENIDVEDKIVIIFSGAPWDYKANQWFQRVEDLKDLDTLQYKINNAEKHGAKGVIIVENPIGWRNAIEKKEILKIPAKEFLIESNIPVLQITKEALVDITSLSLEQIQIFAGTIRRECVPQAISFEDWEVGLAPLKYPSGGWVGRNVIAVLPGKDQELKKEAVVIGAHYDHLGETKLGLNLGANDNASGISALLGIAKAFALSPIVPKRTLVFIAFDAEEIGKIGSGSYVDKPIIPIENTVLMINFDMIARNEENHIFAIASESSNELHQIHQDENKIIGLELEHPENFRLGRSDHSAFYYANVPIIYFFGGKHPGYHTPDDTWDKVSITKVEKVARLAFLTARNVADKEERIQFHLKKD